MSSGSMDMSAVGVALGLIGGFAGGVGHGVAAHWIRRIAKRREMARWNRLVVGLAKRISETHDRLECANFCAVGDALFSRYFDYAEMMPSDRTATAIGGFLLSCRWSLWTLRESKGDAVVSAVAALHTTAGEVIKSAGVVTGGGMPHPPVPEPGIGPQN